MNVNLQRHLFKKIFCNGSFWYVSTLRKKVFSAAPVKFFFLQGSNNSDSVVLGNAGFGEIKDHSLTITPFKKNFCYGSFRYVSTLSKKVFSVVPVKCYFLQDSNNSVVFGNVGFGNIKDHSLTTIPFQKCFCYGRFRYMSTLLKKVFSVAPVKCFFLQGSNNSDCVVFGNVGFGEIKDHSLTTTIFENIFYYGSFCFVSTLRKIVFSVAPVKCFFLQNSHKSDSVVFGNVGYGEIKNHS